MFKIHLTSFVISLFLSTSVFAGTGHKMVEGDLELPIDDVKVVQEGRDWYAQRCAFCHGGGGKGGKGPCLTCGKFSYSGNTNTDIFTTISVGIPRNRGGSMGAFGTSMTPDTIIAVVTFLRAEEREELKRGRLKTPINLNKRNLNFQASK